MLRIVLDTGKNNSDGFAEMFIDYQSDCVGFVVCTKDSKQYDFSIEKEDWTSFKNLIDSQIELTKTK